MDRELWNIFVPKGNRKICRQAVLAVFTFFPLLLLLWKLLVRLSMVPYLRSPLSLDALLRRGKMDYWSIPEPLERRAVKKNII